MEYQKLLKEKISDLSRLPEHRWEDPVFPYMKDRDGSAAVRVAGFQCSLDWDMWAGLRNPAMVGLYPAGLPEIFEYHAHIRRSNLDEDGRASIFKVSRDWDWARKTYTRAKVYSVMLPLSEEVFDVYNKRIKERSQAPWDGYSRIWKELNHLLDKGINRLVYEIMNQDNAVVVMNEKSVEDLAKLIIPAAHKGDSHGYCKGGNYSQKSVAAMTGLGQFGLHRLIMRDEKGDSGIRRMMGPIRSLIVFDSCEVSDNDVNLPVMDSESRRSLIGVNDLTNNNSHINAKRFCTWQDGCGKCLTFCPGKAIENSSPARDGSWSEKVQNRKGFFWEGALQFDGANCADERGQMSKLYEEWMCGRCVSLCAGEGVRKESAALGSI